MNKQQGAFVWPKIIEENGEQSKKPEDSAACSWLAYEEQCQSLVPINGLSGRLQNCVLGQAEIIELNVDQTLFVQGAKDDDLFYLLSGQVELISDEYTLQDIHAGSDAALFALDLFITDPFSIKAVSDVAVLRIRRELLDRILVIDPDDAALSLVDPTRDSTDQWLADFLQSRLVDRLPIATTRKVLGLLESVQVRKGDQVIASGMPCDYYYFLCEGRSSVYYFNHTLGRRIDLGELEAGDYFGEDAEAENAKFCNPVRMLSDGLLLRLGKMEYKHLSTVLPGKVLSHQEASSRVKEGAQWLDVRFPEEYSRDGFQGSINIPLSRLPSSVDELTRDQQYVVYCDKGGRSAAATIWLTEQGFDVFYLQGGIRQVFRDNEMSEEWIDSLSDALRGKSVSQVVANSQASTARDTASIGEQMTEIDHRLRGLKELISLKEDPDDDRTYNAGFEGTDHQAEDLGVLIEARKRIDQIESQPSNKSFDTQPLQDSDTSSGLGHLRKQLENAQEQLGAGRGERNDDLVDESHDSSLEQVTSELENIKIKLEEQESFELKRRQEFEQQLVTERKKMQEQLAKFSSGIELYQSRNRELEKVKEQAILETRRLIEKFKAAHEDYRRRQAVKIQKIRKQMQKQASQVLDTARRERLEKKQALAALREVQRELDELRNATGLPKEQSQPQQENSKAFVDSKVPLLVDIESIGEQIGQAKERLNVEVPKLKIASSYVDEKTVLEEIEHDEETVHNDLVDWFASNDRFRLDREKLTEEQQQRLERVKKIAHEALEEALDGTHLLKTYK